jgi:alkylated DNA repair dioxygenase AlkB
MKNEQTSMFGIDPPVPEGFQYQPALLSVDQEREILAQVRTLPFSHFQFQGFEGKRRVVSYGWRYDFNERQLQQAEGMPDFLLPLREQAAAFAGLTPSELQHALVTEYGPGAAIGWHRDKAMFGDIVGISLLSACTFRLRRKAGPRWDRYSLLVEPRSAYLLRGPSRTDWEHSIPAVDALRFSVTFRNLLPEGQRAY